MPKSKKSQIYNLTKTDKKGRDGKVNLINEVRQCLDKYSHVYLFSVDNMRNTFLKDVRLDWAESRLLFGRNAVVAKALGETVETEYKTGLATLAKELVGNVGLLFTNSNEDAVLGYFEKFVRQDYARSGCRATETIVLPAGPLIRTAGGLSKEAREASHQDTSLILPFPHNMEPQLRALGLPTRLDRGVVTLVQEHVLCKEGELLTQAQAHLLKQHYHRLVEFRVKVLGVWVGDVYRSLAASCDESSMVTEVPGQ